MENGTALSYEGLEVHDLSFAYGGEAVLRGVSMTARKNEIVGIVGESGCGKSTLLKRLLRFWERSRRRRYAITARTLTKSTPRACTGTSPWSAKALICSTLPLPKTCVSQSPTPRTRS